MSWRPCITPLPPASRPPCQNYPFNLRILPSGNGMQRHAPKMEAQLTYWKEQLQAPLPMFELPNARPRGTSLSLRTARTSLTLPEVLVDELKGLSRQEGCTLFMTCLAAFKMLLYGYTGQEDLRVATIVANRARRETEGLIGLLANTVILRTDLGGNPICKEVLQRVRATTLAAYTNQDLPFEELVRTLEGEHNLQRTVLCQVMVVWQDFPLQPPQDFSQTLSFEEMGSSIVAPNIALTTFDIILILRERSHGVTGTCIYKTDLFDATTISQMLDDYQSILVGFNPLLGKSLSSLCSLSSLNLSD